MKTYRATVHLLSNYHITFQQVAGIVQKMNKRSSEIWMTTISYFGDM